MDTSSTNPQLLSRPGRPHVRRTPLAHAGRRRRSLTGRRQSRRAGGNPILETGYIGAAVNRAARRVRGRGDCAGCSVERGGLSLVTDLRGRAAVVNGRHARARGTSERRTLKADVAELESAVNSLISNSLAPASWRLYHTGQRHYRKICHRYRRTGAPASEDTLLYYLGHIERQGLSAPTARAYMSAVRTFTCGSGAIQPPWTYRGCGRPDEATCRGGPMNSAGGSACRLLRHCYEK